MIIRKSRRINLITCLVAAALLPLSAVSQTGLLLTDEQKIGAMVNLMAQRIQYCKPATGAMLVLEDVLVDGVMMTPEALKDTLGAIVSRVPTRNQNVNNPMPASFGPFFDFDIVDQQITGILPEGKVECNYLTIATGEQRAPGLILFEKTDSRWRITTINGLIPFLRAETVRAQEIRKNEPPKREALQLRKKR